MNWGREERRVAALFGGKVCTDRARQLDDIDIEAVDDLGPITISVKAQYACSYTGNISLELALFNSLGESIPGNWSRCRADVLAIVVKDTCYTFDADVLNAWVQKNWERCGLKRLRPETVMTNVEMGREYVDALNLLIPLNAIEGLGETHDL